MSGAAIQPPPGLRMRKASFTSSQIWPGQGSAPHRHNAHVFVYVLEGLVTMQVAGGEPVTLSPGEMFYENPGDIHMVSQNASDSESARFLVHMLKSVGVPVSTPVAAGALQR